MSHKLRLRPPDSIQLCEKHHDQRPLQSRSKRHCHCVSILTYYNFQGIEADLRNSVMGPTGSGKTNVSGFVLPLTSVSDVKNGQFINTLTRSPEQRKANKLRSNTQNVTPYPITRHNHRLVLVDTPGFDDTYRPDSVILREIADWLTQK